MSALHPHSQQLTYFALYSNGKDAKDKDRQSGGTGHLDTQ